MPDTILDPRVRLIVTLRKRGHSEDEITSLTSVFDSLKTAQQSTLTDLVMNENPEMVTALVRATPEILAAFAKPGARSPLEIIEAAAAPFLAKA